MRERGFTLIEIMVALAVFSLAALALIRLEGFTVRGAGQIDRTLAASMVARSVAAEAVTGATPPTLGRSGGRDVNGGERWTWTRDVLPTGNDQVVRVDVAVADARGAVLGRATLVRPPSPPVQP